MPSQFFGLSIASSGIRAANAALNTTANNIANTHTDGYSRQQVTQEAADALRLFTTYGCAGAGVDTVAIERVRDEFYDLRFRNNNSTLGEYDIKKYYTQSIEDYLDDDGDTGFEAIFDEFMRALQDVKNNPSLRDYKAAFIASTQKLAEYFNTTAGNLQALQKDVNEEIKLRVERINSITSEIATMNKQINVVEMTGTRANQLRDKRDLLLDELSEIVDIKTEEYPITDPYDPERETGGTRFIVSIAGNQPIVDGGDYHKLECRSRADNEKVNQSDADGLYDIYWDNGNDFNLNNASMGGSLKGLVAMRDGNNNKAFQGIVQAVTKGQFGTEVTVKASRDFLSDMNKCNLSDTGGSVVIGNTLYYYQSWEYNENDGTFKFIMDDAKCDSMVTAGKIGREVEIGVDINYQGIPYYLSQMNEFVRSFAAKVNEIFTSGYDKNDNLGAMFFTARKPVAGNSILDSQYEMGDFQDADGYYEMTAFNIEINDKLVADPDLLGTKSVSNNGVEENGKLEELVETLRDKTKFSFRNATVEEFLQTILSDVALNSRNAKDFYDTYYGIAVTIENQRMSISSVDEDEEAVNMVKFQNSFTLSSKMVQTLTEIYDRLILETGV
ncbi:MAG: flagellar hook-associated protein FlgK [Kineothrix sp.]|jgi:flagellar hook-associated protein 1 FlgK|nr:flagellar hook-associated protein FlgK [Lachnospiraceae bacterium 28-4]MCI8844773.1 flagellar hook-associated protein FlgK [Lachnospiraceae bacterium]MCX4343409.1 flagellar hook-associated protein FlgK [Kineothrix sp.]